MKKTEEAIGKVLVIGDSGVGKTSLIECIKNGPNHLANEPTRGK
jgi:GTPase SAR1 family protein